MLRLHAARMARGVVPAFLRFNQHGTTATTASSTAAASIARRYTRTRTPQWVRHVEHIFPRYRCINNSSSSTRDRLVCIDGEGACTTSLDTLAKTIPPRIVGLDVNTSSTGFTVLDAEGTVIECGRIDTSKLGSIFEKARDIRAQVDTILAKHTVPRNETQAAQWIIGVEDCLKSFSMPRQSMILLAQMNALVSYDIWQRPHGRLVMIHPNAARTFFGIKKTSKVVSGSDVNQPGSKSNIKLEVFSAVAAYIKGFELEFTSTGNPKPTNFDVTDSFLIAHTARKRFLHEQLIEDPEIQRAFRTAIDSAEIPITALMMDGDDDGDKDSESVSAKRSKKRKLEQELAAFYTERLDIAVSLHLAKLIQPPPRLPYSPPPPRAPARAPSRKPS